MRRNLLAILLIMLFVFAHTAAAQNNPTVTVSPDSGTVGTLFEVDVAGLSANATYTLDFIVGVEVVYTTTKTADANGGVNLLIGTEEGDVVGQYRIEVRDSAGQVVSQGSFTLTEGVLLTNNITISPSAGPIGTLHEIIVTGLNPNETVSVKIASADDGRTVYDRLWTSQQSGRLNITVFGEANDLPGLYYVTVQSQDGRVLARGELTLRAAALPVVHIQPPGGPAGTIYTITVDNVKAAVPVNIDVVDARGIVVFSVETLGRYDRTAVVEFSSPIDLSDGQYSIIAKMERETIAQSSFVIGDAPIPSTVTITPPSGPLGTRHSIAVAGLNPGEIVDIQIFRDGAMIYSTTSTADSGGTALVTIFSEAGDPPGTYLVRALRGGVVLGEGQLVFEGEAVIGSVAVTVSPDSGMIGSNHSIDISGLEAGELVTIQLVYNNQVIYTTERTGDNSGKATVVIFTEAGDPTGSYTVNVLRGTSIIAQSAFTVLGEDAQIAEVTITVDPPIGPIGTSHAIEITGLDPFETVSIEIVFNGTSVLRFEETADGAGAISTSVSSEAGDAPGTYSVDVIRGSTVIAQAPLTIGEEAAQEEPEEEAPPPVTINVVPRVASPGSTYGVSIANLNPGETVTIEVMLNGAVVYTTEKIATEQGNVVFRLFSNEDDALGVYTVNVLRTGTIIVAGNFTIRERGAQPAPAVAMTISPSTGPAGTRHEITLSGLQANENITIEVARGSEIVYTTPKTADAQGRVSLTLFSDQADPAGVYTVRALRGTSSIASSTFTVESAALDSNVRISIDPPAARLGGRYAVTISGLSANEAVTVEVVFGGNVVYTTQKTADAQGGVLLNLLSESGDAAGLYTVRVVRAGAIIAQGDFSLTEGTVADPQPLSISVNPPAGPRGTRFDVTITGLNGGEAIDVDVVLNGSPVYTTQKAADAAGGVIFTLITGENDPEGTYTVNVRRAGSIIGSGTFNVGESAAATPPPVGGSGVSVAVTPPAGPIPTRYTVDIAGLSPNEQVNVRVIFGGSAIFNSDKTADLNGAISFTLLTSDANPEGDYQVEVSRAGSVIAAGSFRVGETAAAPPPPPPPSTDTMPDSDIQISITPSTGPIPTEHTVTVTGLNPSETVVLVVAFNGEAVFTAQKVADASGVVVMVLTSQTNDAPGDYSVTVFRQAAQGSLTIEGSGAAPNNSQESSQPPAQSEASVAVWPRSAELGAAHTVTIANLRPNETLTVAITFEGAVVYSTEQTADEIGIIQFDVFSEQGDPPGIYTVTARRGDLVIGESSFTVNASQSAADPQLRVTPPAGTIGTQHTIEVTNLLPEQTISIQISLNEIRLFTAQATADNQGRALLDFISPADTRPGNYNLRIFAANRLIIETILTIAASPNSSALNPNTQASNADLVDISLAQDQPLVDITPPAGERGTNHIINITGLIPEEKIVVLIAFDALVVYSTEKTADENGAVSFPVVTESGDSPGNYEVVVYRGSSIIAESILTIVDSAQTASTVTLVVTPPAGERGTTHIIDIAGLTPDETVTVHIAFNSAVVYTTEKTADENGAVSFPVVTESGDSSGDYEVIVYRGSDIIAESVLTIVDSAQTASTVTLVVTPPAGERGTTHIIDIAGLTPDETITVNIALNSAVVYTTEKTADENGAVSFPIVTESGDSPGDYTVLVYRGVVLIAESALTILDTTAAQPDSDSLILISPASGSPETVFTASISELRANVTVRVQVIQLETGDVVLNERLETDANGAASIEFQLEDSLESGTYAIVVRDLGLEIRRAEFALENSAAPVETVDASLDDTIQAALTTDQPTYMYLFRGKAGERVTILLTSIAFDPYLQLLDSSGQVIAENDDAVGLDAQIFEFILPADDDYTIIATSSRYINSSGSFSATGDFTLSAATLSGATASDRNAAALALDEPVEESLTEVNPFREYSFEGSQGDLVTITLNSPDFDAYLVLFDDRDLELASSDDAIGLDAQINTFQLPYSGRYTIFVTSYEFSAGDPPGFGTFTLRLSEPLLAEFGELVSGQTDTINGITTLSFRGRNRDNISLQATVTTEELGFLTLYAPDGSELFFDFVGDGNTVLRQVLLPEDGVYTVRLEFFSSSEGTSFSAYDYDLRLDRVNLERIGLEETAAGSLSGLLSTDYYLFDASAGETFLVTAESEYPILVRLQDEDGYVVSESRKLGGAASSLTGPFIIPYDGRFIISVTAEADTAGLYDVTVSIPVAQPLSYSPDRVELNFDAQTTYYYYTFEAKSGDLLDIVVDGGGVLDTQIEVYDQEGLQIGIDDDSGRGFDPELNQLAIFVDGTYTLIVKAFNPGDVGTAQLSFTVNAPLALGDEPQVINLNSKLPAASLSFEANQGESYLLRLEPIGGQQRELILSVNQGDREVLFYNAGDLNAPITVAFTLPASETVVVNIFDETGSSVSFELTLEKLSR